MSLLDDLSALPPFDMLSAPALRSALREAQEVSLRTGRALCCQGDRADRCWVLVSGSARGVMYRSDETTVERGRSRPGDWLGLAEALLDGPYLADILAEEHCRLAGFGLAGLGRLLELPGMRGFLLKEMARRYYALHSRMELVQPIDRLARYLLDRLAGVSGEVVCTQDEIAESIGVTRETVNRHLQRLQEDGLVRVSRGSISIPDAGRLRSLDQDRAVGGGAAAPNGTRASPLRKV